MQLSKTSLFVLGRALLGKIKNLDPYNTKTSLDFNRLADFRICCDNPRVVWIDK
jgi:hypothetical protein